MKIALDTMGGDFAPRENVEGALLAARKHGIQVVLVGDETKIQKELQKSRFATQLIEVVHASESVGMHEKATASIRTKKDTSMQIGINLLKENKVQAFISPGHTGALMTAATLTLKRLPGIERPAIAGQIPTLRGSCVVLDLGANVDCRVSQLVQFATMGRVYAKIIEKKDNPKVGLLSNGSEDSKGNELIREANQLLKTQDINYVGYVESKDVFKGKVDVVVCDGFVGNIFLKTIEGVVSATSTLIKRDIQKTWVSKMLAGLFYYLFRNTLKNMGQRFDYSEHGAAPLLGINGLVFVCHGKSSRRAIKNAIVRAHSSVQTQFLAELNKEINQAQAS